MHRQSFANRGRRSRNRSVARRPLLVEGLERRALLNADFQYALGVPTSGVTGAQGIAADVAGNAYVTGSFQGTIDFDPGPGVTELASGGITDIFVAKYSPTGALLWARALKGAGNTLSTGNAVVVDPAGNTYATGTFQGTVDFDPGPNQANRTADAFTQAAFVVKLDSAGNFQWVKTFGGTLGVDAQSPNSSSGQSLALSGNGPLYVGGFLTGSVSFKPGDPSQTLTSAGGFDGFTLKLDALGNTVWADRVGGAGDEYTYGLALDGADNLYATGTFTQSGDFNPTSSGTTTLNSAGGTDIYITKVSSNNTFGWAKRIGGTNDDRSNGIAATTAGSLYLTGGYQGTVDFDPGPDDKSLSSMGNSRDIFVLNLNSAGAYGWAKSFGTNSVEDIGNGVATDSAGNAYVAARYQGTIDFSSGAGTANLSSDAGSVDAVLLKFNPAGTLDYAKSGGGVGFDTATQLAVRKPDDFLAVGRTYPPSAFGGFTINNSAQQDFYVTRLSSTPAKRVMNDFDGDGKSDVGVYQPGPSTFTLHPSSLSNVAQTFGQGTNYGGNPVPVTGDFDGDGKTDIGVYQPSDSTFTLYNFGRSPNIRLQFGQGTLYGGHPIPITGDFDGDGTTDVGVYQPTDSTYTLHPLAVGANNIRLQFGQGTLYGGHPIPITGDFDGDGTTDVGVYQPTDSTYTLHPLAVGATNLKFQFGQGTLYGGKPVPVTGDFDGDGKTDVGVYQPTDSSFTLHPVAPGANNIRLQFGQGTLYGGNPIPVTGDFDGDGRTDVGVYQPDKSYFTLNTFTSGNFLFQFGQGRLYGGNPIPLPVPFGTGSTVHAASVSRSAPLADTGAVAPPLSFWEALNNKRRQDGA